MLSSTDEKNQLIKSNLLLCLALYGILSGRVWVILLLLADKVYKTSALERSLQKTVLTPHYYTDATFPPRVDVSLYLLLLGHHSYSLYQCLILVPPDLDAFQ